VTQSDVVRKAGTFFDRGFARTDLVLARASLELKLPPLCISPHVELIMAPHAGFDPDSIKQKARKDLLHLLEGVSKVYPSDPAGLMMGVGN